MLQEKPQHRVLIVSDTDKISDYITELLPKREFYPIHKVGSAGEAKRLLISETVDIIIINTPLPDEFGTELALDLSEGTVGIMLLVKADSYDEVCYKVESSGVLTLAKPNSRQAIYSAIRLLAAMSVKLGKLEKKNRTLQEKMADIRIVNRAKWLLIENMSMTEKDAHYYIEKQAMDTRLSRREIAESIVRTYDK
ncbi:MAG: ANTAR domain-containing response regulator [Eubacteriales bacterium]